MNENSFVWPIYFKDRLRVSNLNSGVAIATLWTPVEAVEKLIDKDAYCVMGQLYTKKGINYILRNVLANPQIHKIYIVGNDLMDSGKALLLLKQNGIDENYKVKGDESAEIEKEISIEAINLFRSNVEIVDMIGPQNLIKLKDSIKFEDVKNWGEPMTFEDPPKVKTSVFSSEFDLIKIRRAKIADAYPSVLKHIMMFGAESLPFGGYSSDTSNKMRELINLSVSITEENPDDFYVPNYMPFAKPDLENYLKGFFDPDKHTEDYTYGERLFNYAQEEINQLKEIYPWLKIDRFQEHFIHGGFDQVSISIIRKLKNFPHDKGAIALLGNPFTDVFPRRPGKKIPCLFLIQAQIFNNKLNLTAYFRSNDMYNAWPLNTYALRKLQKDISLKLKTDLGTLVTISNMAHIYEHNYTDAQKIIDNNYSGGCEWDPRGNLVVEVIGKEIVVRLISPDGNNELNEWRVDGTKHKAARDLSFKLEQDLAISTLGNAIYMGRQLERADTAVKLGLEFKQDESLDFRNFNNYIL
jgi:thymidylate synthase